MAINEMALRKWTAAVERGLERHETLLKRCRERDKKALAIVQRHETLLMRGRERDKKILAVIKQLLEINKGTIDAMPTDKELSGHRAARKKLSKGERPVYDLMFMYRDQEIADKLILSVHTVKGHMKNIRKKLGITRGRKDLYMQRNQSMTLKERLRQEMSINSGTRPLIAEEWADKIDATVKETKAALVELTRERVVRPVDTRAERAYSLMEF